MPTTSRDVGPGQGGKDGMRSGNPDTTVPDIDRAAPGRHPPLISLVVSCFRVASFLPAFLESLRRQTVSLKTVDLIFVNDGSPDDSREIIRAWIERHAWQARLVDQENQGLCGARNAGMAVARGTWVSFPDPDDVLDPRYLQRVTTFITEAGDEVDLLSTHLLMLDDTSGRLTDDHPLNQKFRPGTQVVDLDRHPNYIHLQAASAFYRLGRVMEQGLLFDPAIVPNFEDGYFTALYLADRVAPRVGVVADAYYHYRLRADGSSAVQTSWQHPDKYVNLPRRGYLRLAEQVVARLGFVPVWVQNTILYDLLFYFRQDERVHSASGSLPAEVVDTFHRLVREILAYVDTETIDAFTATPTSRHLKEALIIGYRGDHHRPHSLPLVRMDAARQIVQIRYFFGGDQPAEEWRVRGHVVKPVYAKTRAISYYDRVLLRERIVWLPATGTVRAVLDGRPMPLTYGRTPEPLYTARPVAIWDRLSGRRPPHGPWPTLDRPRARITSRVARRLRRIITRADRSTTPADVVDSPPAIERATAQAIQEVAASPDARRIYGNAWTFMDRDTQANDNAEHLYRYVREHQPAVNAWFVLRRDSADWPRLAAEGFRLVEFGTHEHNLLLINTVHLISSQVDHYVVHPLDRTLYGNRSWRFTFLQHGVTKDDLSRWVNGKPISRFITASTAEHASIAGDQTPYIFTEKEVELTGFPRHDRLWELGRDHPDPRLVLIMPTWRRSLLGAELGDGNTRELRSDFAETPFWQGWNSVISSERLRAAADDAGCEVVFMPHPNMQVYIDTLDLPSWVRICRYSDSDVQELLADAAVVVTDYSSNAFEAGYLLRPVVYFQFDQKEFFSGSHVYRKGTWDYDEHGFGPVAIDTEATLDAVADAMSHRTQPAEPYLSRMREAFPHRDGRCCERTYSSIRALNRPLTYEQAYRIIPPSSVPSRHPAYELSGGAARPS